MAQVAEDLKLWRYGVGVSVPIICIFGVIGNILSLLVLSNKNKFGVVMFTYVRCMSVADLLAMFICIAESLSLSWSVQYDNVNTARYFAHVSLPLLNTFFSVSTLIVLLMTVERFMSICFPLSPNFLSTPNRSNLCIGCIYVICFAIYLPTVGEFVIVETAATPNQSLVSDHGKFTINWREGYADNVWYQEVYSWSRAIILRFIPFIAIFILNVCTIRTYHGFIQRRRQNKTEYQCRMGRRRHKEENNLIIILVSTAAIYIICLCPMPIAHIMRGLETLKHNHNFQIYLIIDNHFC